MTKLRQWRVNDALRAAPPRGAVIGIDAMHLSRNPWLRLSVDIVKLGMESQSVVALRLMKFARGGYAAAEEAHLMVSEKVGAAMSAPLYVASDMLEPGPGAAQRTTTALLRKVRANRRRLSRTG